VHEPDTASALEPDSSDTKSEAKGKGKERVPQDQIVTIVVDNQIVQPEPPEVGKDDTEHQQIRESILGDFEEPNIQSGQLDTLVDCQSTEHSGDLSLVD
jgi:hypothetical protein